MKGELAHLACEGAEILVRVLPGARANTIEFEGDALCNRVTAPPEDGKANAAVQKLLARALGIPKCRLTLVQSARAREKRFRLD